MAVTTKEGCSYMESCHYTYPYHASNPAYNMAWHYDGQGNSFIQGRINGIRRFHKVTSLFSREVITGCFVVR